MTEQELYNQIHTQLFKNGSGTPNQWQFIKVNDGQRVAAFEVIYPTKGNIKIRKPIKKQRTNADNQEIWLYSVMRFTNKKELKDDGLIEDIRLDQKEAVTQ